MTPREKAEAAKLSRRQARDRQSRADEAAANWKRLGEAEQLRTVCEIVETRGRELARAYRGVVSVGWGYGTKCVKRPRRPKPGRARKGAASASANAPATIRRRRNEVCVTFVVRRKLSKAEMRRLERNGERPAWAVPRYLLHYAGRGERRRLCAVPTDVEHAADHRYRGHDARIAVGRTPGASTVTAGSATCVVRRPAVNNKLYLLSCRHVLGMMDQGTSNFPVGAVVSRCSDPADNSPFTAMPPPLARTTGFHGVMVPGQPGEARSFDAAIAEVIGNPQAVRPLVPQMTASPGGGNPFEPFAADIISLSEAIVHAPDGPKRVDPTRVFPAGGLPMRYRGVTGVFFMRVALIEYLPRGTPTMPGDSGSPVTNLAGDKLLGMHIGGSEDGNPRPFGVMIPAFELVKTDHYVGLPRGNMLQIVVNF